MMTYETAFAQELEKLIHQAIDRIKHELARGWTINDFADYRYKAGQIAALEATLAAFGEAQLNAKKR